MYSKKTNWTEQIYAQLYQIKDFKQAGLDKEEYYADLGELQDYPIEELVKFQKIGHLSNRDIDGLIETLEAIYA